MILQLNSTSVGFHITERIISILTNDVSVTRKMQEKWSLTAGIRIGKWGGGLENRDMSHWALRHG